MLSSFCSLIFTNTDPEPDVSYSFSDAVLNQAYSNATSGFDTAAVILTDGNQGFQNALGVISQGIPNLALPVLDLFDTAVSTGGLLTAASEGLPQKIDDFQEAHRALKDALEAPVKSSQWSKWVRLERLQVIKHVLLDDAIQELGAAEELLEKVDLAKDGFGKADDFEAIDSPTWNEAVTLFNDPDFLRLIDAYKAAYEIAKNFLNYREELFSGFREVYRNLLRFETAKLYLESDFNFEKFKSDYLNNVAELNDAGQLLAKIALQAELEAKLDSLLADQSQLDLIGNHNSATVDFFQTLKTQAQNRFNQVTQELTQAYTFTIHFFFGASWKSLVLLRLIQSIPPPSDQEILPSRIIMKLWSKACSLRLT